MSLSLIKDIAPFPPYEEGETGLFGGAEFAMRRFVYDRSNDEFITGLLIIKAGWQSPFDTFFYNYFFDGETGVFKRREAVPTSYWAFFMLRDMPWANGSFGQVYGLTRPPYFPQGWEINVADWWWREGGWYSSLFGGWDPAPDDMRILTFCAERNIMVGVNGHDVQIWDLSGTPALVAELRLPGDVLSIGYESKAYVWFITSDGIIIKMNYETSPPRWEMMSSVLIPSPDAVAYRTCYDTRRKRVVVLRVKEDVGGQNPSVIEFYRPYYVATQITDPVPINKLAGNTTTSFIGHLLGSIGEGVAAQQVSASLAAPVQGDLRTTIAPTTQNGSLLVKYQAPNALYTGTLQLTADINESWD